MSENISISVAGSEDYDLVLNVFHESFYKEEPIVVCHPESGHAKEDEDFVMSFLSHGTILIARDASTGDIVGALSAGPVEIGNAENMIEDAKMAEKEKWRDILLLLAYIEKKADVFNRFSIEKAHHIHALGVHPSYHRQGIGEKLIVACLESAMLLSYSIVTSDCSTFITAKICEKLGMQLISTVTYDEYHKAIKQETFSPKAPNLEIKTYVMKV